MKRQPQTICAHGCHLHWDSLHFIKGGGGTNNLFLSELLSYFDLKRKICLLCKMLMILLPTLVSLVLLA